MTSQIHILGFFMGQKLSEVLEMNKIFWEDRVRTKQQYLLLSKKHSSISITGCLFQSAAAA